MVAGGELNYWVKERREWWHRHAVPMAANGGSEVLTFVVQE
jgi:hypothetical protein